MACNIKHLGMDPDDFLAKWSQRLDEQTMDELFEDVLDVALLTAEQVICDNGGYVQRGPCVHNKVKGWLVMVSSLKPNRTPLEKWIIRNLDADFSQHAIDELKEIFKITERVAAAALNVGKYDDFGEPIPCDACKPPDPEPFESARRELYLSLEDYEERKSK